MNSKTVFFVSSFNQMVRRGYPPLIGEQLCLVVGLVEHLHVDRVDVSFSSSSSLSHLLSAVEGEEDEALKLLLLLLLTIFVVL